MVTLKDIWAARERMNGAIVRSRCAPSYSISQLTNGKVWLKFENMQMTGSYKERGALNKILTLSNEERVRGLVAASAGNHAQAVSYHATERGISAQIVMPMATPLNKVMSTRRFGAEVVLHGANYDEACVEAQRRCTEQGRTFIHPFDDDAVMAGQGTIGLELLEQVPDVDVLVASIGGGGMISGVACAIKELNPKVRVVGVQTSRLPSMKAAVDAGELVTLPVAATLADGIAVRRAGEHTFPMVQRFVDEIVTVEEDEIASAILLLLEREKTLVEGAGAAPVAALLHRKISDVADKKVAAVISGGNLDVSILSRIIERGLAEDGRMVRLRIHLPDYPGALHRLTGVLAQHRANIVQTAYDRTYFGVDLGNTAIDLTMETRGSDHVKELIGALTAENYQFERIE
ncbi:MAG TPA: threonine ammonia-lyase [Terriglobales bacterium]|nr:threonine ammonia-lyase [Terriglobales bacterium]